MKVIEWIWGIIGTFMLIMRIYLVEFKLRQQLGKKRHYLSRFINIYFWILMIIGFQSNILSLTVYMTTPVMLFSLIIYDTRSIAKIVQNRKRSIYPWIYLIIERITLHLPIIVMFTSQIFLHIPLVSSSINWISIFSAATLNLGTFFIFDPRNPFYREGNYSKREGMMIFLINSLTLILILLIYQ